MFESIYAQLRFTTSLLFGRPFHLPSLNRLIDTLIATRQEFGTIGRGTAEFLNGPAFDTAALQEIQWRRFRKQLQRGIEETTHYAALFADLGLDAKKLTLANLHQLPLTDKAVLHKTPAAFLRQGQTPTFSTLTTGTTGTPTTLFFTTQEMATYVALSAISFLLQGVIGAEDVVQVSTSARALLGNSVFMGACQRIGALVYQTGIVEPAHTLALLAEPRAIPGKKARPSVLMTYPSYLGKLIETGQQLGYGPADFGIERIILGGEIVTPGVKRRCQALFGPVKIHEGYGISEAWPVGGTRCEQGHLHFDPMSGLVEVIDMESGNPVAPGEVGTLVLTPFAPHRESMVILRYNTGDLVQALAESCTCSLRHQPATGPLLGKARLSVHHRHGWTTPRSVLEALERLELLPLPARAGFWAHEDGVTVEVAVAAPSPELHAQIMAALWAQDVPVRALYLRTSTEQLINPLPWRGDLVEQSFTSNPSTNKEAVHANYSAV